MVLYCMGFFLLMDLVYIFFWFLFCLLGYSGSYYSLLVVILVCYYL